MLSQRWNVGCNKLAAEDKMLLVSSWNEYGVGVGLWDSYPHEEEAGRELLSTNKEVAFDTELV